MIDSRGLKVGQRVDSSNHPENRPETPEAPEFNVNTLETTLSRWFRFPVGVRSMTPLAGRPGRATSFRIDYEVGGERRAALLEPLGDPATVAPAAEAAPPAHHIRVLGAGRIAGAQDGISASFRLTEFAEGRAYGEDLVRLKLGGLPGPRDAGRAEALAAHLAEIHRRHGHPKLYGQHVRDLIGGADGIFGILDGFPVQDGLLIPELLEHLEHRALKWRWRLKGKTHRLRRIHGNFNPWKILFRDGADFSVVDTEPARWGEPADDVACLTANYLVFALQSQGESRRMLFDLNVRVWSEYIAKSGDSEILEVAAPFVVRHVLALVNPAWAPDLKLNVRRALFSLMFRILDLSRFEPYRLEAMLRDD